MNEELPGVEDLAVVVKGHCEASARDWVGVTLKVVSIFPAVNFICTGYGSIISTEGVSAEDGRRYDRYSLRRIPPLSDLEGIEDARDLTREKELVR